MTDSAHWNFICHFDFEILHSQLALGFCHLKFSLCHLNFDI
jgi:hypothetical protein